MEQIPFILPAGFRLLLCRFTCHGGFLSAPPST
jgi:hypothetical protein